MMNSMGEESDGPEVNNRGPSFGGSHISHYSLAGDTSEDDNGEGEDEAFLSKQGLPEKTAC